MRVIAPELLRWYDRHARVLPWRSPPGVAAPDAYRIWLSEVMLQQTTVAAVKPYYERFLARWPTVEALAAADDTELMAAWAGLGYYSRARNLLACARAIVTEHGGRFPGSAAELKTLPGVGDYTAAAIAAIAFDEPAAVVDGNVERVVARLFALDTKAAVRVKAAELTPAERPGDHAQAMMDLGATICTPKKPACAICPVRSDCRAFELGAQEAYPVKPAKAARPHRRGYVFWAEAEGHVLLVTRPAKGLLGGMRGLPSGGWNDAPSLDEAPFAADWRVLDAPVRHVFTHFSLDLSVACARVPRLNAAGEWWPIERLGEAGLPTVFDKAARLALRERMTETCLAC
jgi:A/G-specific adenine glycosylase